MICNICGKDEFVFIRKYSEPDKYERWMGLAKPLCRAWWKCGHCGFHKASRSYPLELLTGIYADGYRNVGFRGCTVEEAFDKIIALPERESENAYRVRWFNGHIMRPTGKRSLLLDVGAGLGVFLWELKQRDNNNFWQPYAVELNIDSVKLLNNTGIKCWHPEGNPPYPSNMNVVSCIHTLEHVEDPEDFLCEIKDCLVDNGKLFLEVPDAREFDYLPPDHDEFNSCHCTFFTPETLMWLVQDAGFNVTDLHMVRTKARDLSRIMLLAEKV
jgi:SAM-dependent methyltransferase